jgi:guanosine-3',5'-bis(diphosphate) 3'-pyrophosphohydrolase
MWTIDEVKSFAKQAHAGQKRWTGADYYEDHLLAVYENTVNLLEFYGKDLEWHLDAYGFTRDDVLAASLLHDTLEDTSVTYDEIVERFGKSVARIVYVLTRPREMEYAEYIFSFIDDFYPENVFAAIIKIADLQHNSSNFPVEQRNNKYSKYLLSKRILENYLAEIL